MSQSAPSPGHMPPQGAPIDSAVRSPAESVAGGAIFRRVSAHVKATDERTLQDQMDLTAIPAPPFAEGSRGQRFAELLAEYAEHVSTDSEGNVLGWQEGVGQEPPLVVAAHLDTVFPPGTDVTVHRRGSVLRAPGISDDGRGLAVILALARILGGEGIRTRRPILWVATVGEEGPGDLRGVKHLFGPEGAGRSAWGFISVDGAGLDRIVTRGLGSRRFRIRVDGPGGHSWVDWDTPNPIHALGRTVARLADLDLPRDPVATLTVARWSGGTSINSIPEQAWVEVDTRSESEEHLRTLEKRLREVARDALVEPPDTGVGAGTNRGRGRLDLTVERIGTRPGGITDHDHPLVHAAWDATVAVGGSPQFTVSSTDANIPMAAGIAAVTVGGGGEAGGAHTLKEWYRNIRGPEGVERALLTILTCTGLDGD